MKNIMRKDSERITLIIKPGIIFPIMIEKGERRVDIKTSMVLLFFSDNKDSEVRKLTAPIAARITITPATEGASTNIEPSE
jgi:hypothetical protein